MEIEAVFLAGLLLANPSFFTDGLLQWRPFSV